MDKPVRPTASEQSLLHNFGPLGFDREGEIEDLIKYVDDLEAYTSRQEADLMAELGTARQIADKLQQEAQQLRSQVAFYELKLNSITLIMR